jgi:Tfp pilus assembly protein PilF
MKKAPVQAKRKDKETTVPPIKKDRLTTPPNMGTISGKANLFIVLSFFVFAFILYGNTILNKYAVDDMMVTNNEVVSQGLKALPTIFTSRYHVQEGNIGTTSSDYRPVVKATFALEYQLWGQKPGRSHVINVLIYAALSTLLFFLLKRLLVNYNILFPFLATLLFMAHPVHTEVVASLKNRDEMLAFTAGLGGLWFILNYLESRKIVHLFIMGLIFITGYLSKSSIISFLLLYPLAIWFFTGATLKRMVPFFTIVLLMIIIAQFGPKLFLPQVPRSNHFIENPLFFDKDFSTRAGTGLVTLLFYLKLLVYPYPLRYYYGYDMIPVTDITGLLAIASLVVHAFLLFIAFRWFRSKHLLSFAILWHFIAIGMYSNFLVPVVGIVGERFVFNASLGFSIALLWLVFRLFRTDPRSLTIEMDARLKIVGVVLLLLIPYTVMSFSRNPNWRNLLVLYHHDIKTLNNSAKANIDYAGYLMNSVYQEENFIKYGRVNEFKYQIIISRYRRALDIYPDNYQVVNDLGTVYLFMGKNYDSAVYYLRKAIRIDSTLQPAWVNLGMAYRNQKRYDEALACYDHILKSNPNQVKAIFAMADVYNDMGQFDRAVKMNEEMMAKYPGLEMPYVNIGNYHMLRHDTATAVSYWEKAVTVRPTFELCVQLNSLYILRRDKAKADYYYNLGMELAGKSKP